MVTRVARVWATREARIAPIGANENFERKLSGSALKRRQSNASYCLEQASRSLSKARP